MALPHESATDKLLREMRQRDLLLKRAAGGFGLSGDPLQLARLASPGLANLLAVAQSPSNLGLVADLASRGVFDQTSDALGLNSQRRLDAVNRAAQGLVNQSYDRVNEAAQGNYPAPPGETRSPGPTPRPSLPNSVQLTGATQLGAMIRQARKAMRLNQAQFAAQAGVGRRFLSELEGGKPSLEFDKVLACAAAAGIDLLAKPRRG